MNTTDTKNNKGRIAVGIDIGTTTVSAVVYDIDNKKQLEAVFVPHDSYMCSGDLFEQSTEIILDVARTLLYRIIDTYTGIIGIGVTGQMHGIVYIDDKGKAVSNLINWQDKRADKLLLSGKTACQTIFDITKEKISTGYGLATHYYNMLVGKVPENATSLCSIMDLFCMEICEINKPVTHSSIGASFGLFDVEKGEFKYDKLSLLGIDKSFLPDVTADSIVIGECRGIPVCVPIGDNQASFLGSVSNNNESLLVNIGTGSQVSSVSEYKNVSGDIEIRPFIEGKYLICGSALCGGYAYSMLESFFRAYATSIGQDSASQYEIMNKLAMEEYRNGKKSVDVDVSFLGKRSDPNHKGSINNIGKDNFTPSALILGVLNGMCSELYGLYNEFGESKTHIVASGGAVRKNDVLKSLLSDRFGMAVSLNGAKEEAALGVALFSALATKKITYVNGFSEHISYKQ